MVGAMLNGLQVLESIDDSLARARRDADLIDQEIAALSNRLLALRDEAAAAYRTLARLRLTGGGRDALIEQLTEADQRLKALLAERGAELARLDEEIERVRAEKQRMSQPRDAASGELDRRERALAAGEASARAALGETNTYREAHAAMQIAEQTARFAAQKSVLAARDRQQKGAAYESDPLFVYLWRRRYGTPDYRANPLSRYIDSKVARVCDFERARPNYAMLLEIPLRLAAHAELRQAAVDEQKDALRRLEQTALSTPELSALRAERDLAKRAHDEVDARVNALDARIDELGEERGRFNRGDDDLSRRASASIESALRRADLQTLREAAIGTPLEEDDAAVQQLEAIDVERARSIGLGDAEANSTSPAGATGRVGTRSARLSSRPVSRRSVRFPQRGSGRGVARRGVARCDFARRVLGQHAPAPTRGRRRQPIRLAGRWRCRFRVG
ncbi:MAG: hypothetical protein U1E83_11550 [Methylotetracoccus sp.]